MSALNWSSARNLLGLIEKRVDNELGIAPEVVEDWKHRFAGKAFDIAESYIDGELALVVSLRSRREVLDECELVLVAIPPVVGDSPVSLSSSFELKMRRPRLWLDSNAVLVGSRRISDCVDCVVASGVTIPSFVWLKAVEGRPKSLWDFLAPMGQIQGILGPGKVDIFGGRSAEDGLNSSIHGLVDAMSKVANDPKCESPPRSGRALSEPEFMRVCAGLRIELCDFSYRIAVEKPINAPLQIVNVVPCPLQK